MTPAPFRILHVDDEQNALDQVRELLEGDDTLNELGGVKVISVNDFSAALEHLDRTPADIVILDVMEDHGMNQAVPKLAGREAFEQIRAKVFVPVIFYTGFAPHIADLQEEMKLLRVVEKGNAERLIEAVGGVLKEGLPTLSRGLREMLQEVQRQYMWEFVAHHWPYFREQRDPAALAHLLVRRFALSLSTQGAAALISALPGQDEESGGGSAGGKVHPISMYVMPPIPDASPMAGDVRHGEIAGTDGHWIVLTPSCDFAQGRADFVLLAACERLADQPEMQAFLEDTEASGKRKKLERLMGNRGEGRQADRHHFLPGALDLPDLLVDLRALKTVPREQFDALTPAVSLNAPFAEALLAQFARYVGRLGTPDPDLGLVIERLREEGAAASP